MERDVKKDLLKKVVKIRKAKLLPRGYAKLIAERLNISEQIVYNVTAGNNYHGDVIDIVIEMAEESRVGQQLERAKKVLEEEE